jgi:hypothetical protein
LIINIFNNLPLKIIKNIHQNKSNDILYN